MGIEIVIVIMIILLSVRLMCVHSSVNVGRIEREAFIQQQHLGFPSKCFSCERQLPEGMKWMGQPTKCFSCERNTNGLHPQMTHPSRCLSCAMGVFPR
jgi:DNA-directed RNA polymerase subunit N (RpoN/RPB10)